MQTEIYKLPKPSSWFDSPKFFERLRRSCELIWNYEKDEGSETIQLSLTFAECWAVKITYFVAADVEMSHNAYDKVVDFGETDWLSMVRSNIATAEWEVNPLHHFGIFFDDGPLYEFICETFETKEMTI